MGLVLAAAPVSAADPENGRALFARECSGCHSFSHDINHYAPNLGCLIGRAFASSAFDRYTEDMRAVAGTGLVWSEQNLAAFLADPEAFVAAVLGKDSTSILMQVSVEAEADRSDLVAYIASRCRS